MQISLVKILKNESFNSVVKDLAQSMPGGVMIEDHRGKALLEVGHVQSYHERYAVTFGRTTIGMVQGSPEVRPLAALLEHQAAVEVERRSLAADTLHKYKEVTLLYDLVEKVAACLDRQEAGRLVIEQAIRVIRLDRIRLMLFNQDNGQLDVLASHGPEPQSFWDQASPEYLIVHHVLDSGQSKIVNNVDSDPRFSFNPDQIRAMMCAPLKTSESTIGAACISSWQDMDYRAEDLKLFTTLTYLAAAAIENAGLYEQLKEAFFVTVYALAETIEKRYSYTGGHTRRVMEYSMAMGRSLGLDREDLTRLQLAAILHDVGKIGVRDNVLLKEARLSPEEFAQIKQHPRYGAEILENIKQLHDIVPGIRYHHERFDGRGYPDGLNGEEADIIARIIAVADAFDAMTSDRPYRKGMLLEEAFAQLRENAGTQFDPRMVQAFFDSRAWEICSAEDFKPQQLQWRK